MKRHKLMRIIANFMCEVILQSKCTVCKKAWRKNGQISTFISLIDHITYTSNMAACYDCL